MIILFDKTEITEFQAKKCTYKIVRFGLQNCDKLEETQYSIRFMK